MMISAFNETYYSEKLKIQSDEIGVIGRKMSLPIYLPENQIHLTNQNLIDGVKNYKTIIISTLEHIRIDYYYEFIEYCISNGKKLIFDTFTFGYEDVLKEKYNSELIVYRPIELNILKVIDLIDIHKNKIISDKSKLLKFCAYNRNLGKDYIIWELYKRNLLYNENNNITYHNHLFNQDDKSLDKLRNMRGFYSEDDLAYAGDIDFEFLKDLYIVPDSEKFEVGSEQKQQRDRLVEMHSESMFNIILEASYSFTPTITDPKYNFISIYTKTIFPIYFKNVFHIMPGQYKLATALKDLGFELFFNSDDEFFNNLNEEFYYREDTQSKLNHNRNQIIKIYNNQRTRWKNGEYQWIYEHIS